jgi:hypothetical protein
MTATESLEALIVDVAEMVDDVYSALQFIGVFARLESISPQQNESQSKTHH